ncbi:hypothetical protein H0H92_011141 [Tricholoma furcatifolium]|nr:hypothetical protein H0H92_011141 [Tricholoma furcatifolium]
MHDIEARKSGYPSTQGGLGQVLKICIAYTIDPAYEAEVRDYLDYREKVPRHCIFLLWLFTTLKDGYTMETIDIYEIDGGTESILIHGAFVGGLLYSTHLLQRPDL